MCIVACLQINSNHNVDENLANVSRMLSDFSGDFDILLLPENFAHMPRNEKERLLHAEPFSSGKIHDFLRKIADEYHCWVIAGSVAILPDSAASQKEQGIEANKIFQSSLVFDDSGVLRKRYDKTHLFDVTLGNGEQYHESKHIEFGDPKQDPTVMTPWGVVGLSICYDLRFPEFYRSMPDETFLVCVPAAFTQKKVEKHIGRPY